MAARDGLGKKKKRERSSTTTTEMVEVPSMEELVSRAKRYDMYLHERLTGLPRELLGGDEAEEARVPAYAAKFYKNQKGSAPEQARKEASKRAKRLKYDLDAAAREQDSETPELAAPRATSEPVDDVRARLQAKLAEAKAGRRPASPGKVAERRASKKKDKSKKKGATTKASGAPAPAAAKTEAVESAPVLSVEPMEVEIATLRAPPKRLRDAGKVGAPGSKARRLKALADEAEATRKHVADLRAAGKEAEAVAIGTEEAVKLASGEIKAPLDPAKLRKALKAREKKKLKSKAAWQARLAPEPDHDAADDVPKKKTRKQRKADAGGARRRASADDDRSPGGGGGKKKKRTQPPDDD